MKKWLMLFLVAIIFSCCVNVPQKNEDPINEDPIKELAGEEKLVTDFNEPLGYEILQGDFQAQQIPDIVGLLVNNLQYEPGIRCSSPKETYLRGKATVNELAIMFVNVAYVNFESEIDLALVDTREIFNDGFGEEFHLMPCYEGIVYNLFNLTRHFKTTPIKIYKFREIYKYGVKPIPLSKLIIVPDKNI